MSQLRERLESLAAIVNRDAAKRATTDKWIGREWGRIITFKTPEECYHLVFTRQTVALRDGSYPSCEAYYEGSAEALLQVLDGKLSAYGGAKRGQLKMRGSLNEANVLETLI